VPPTYRAEQYPGLLTADPPICAVGPAVAVLRRCEQLRRGDGPNVVLSASRVVNECSTFARMGSAAPRDTNIPQDADLLAELASAYAAANVQTSSLRAFLARVYAGSALYVGSGGALAIARLAADLHGVRSGAFANWYTPLGLAGLPASRRAALAVISARASHHDVQFSIKHGQRLLLTPVGVITTRSASELAAVAAEAEIVTVPIRHRDRFLATGSLIGLSAALVQSAGFELPPELPHLANAGALNSPQREMILVLHGPRGAPVATDLETRLAELGVAACQVADYRNFAHGRHLGLSRNLDRTAVVAIAAPEDADVAEATLALLPAEARVVRLTSALPWPAGVLDLFVGSARLADAIARQSPWGAARRPRVAPFGRRLYHVRLRPKAEPEPAPVRRKMLALGGPADARTLDGYAAALRAWQLSISRVRFGGVVVDYDGTVCATAERFELPRLRVRTQLLRLLDAGVGLGFASGRGESLAKDLRRWVPEVYWGRIVIGLHNGSEIRRLADDATTATSDGEIAELQLRLKDHPASADLIHRAAPTQLSLSSDRLGGDDLLAMLTDVAAREPALRVRVLRSAHTVDAIATGSKARVVDAVASASAGLVLVIGDQGQTGGNDHELLAVSPWTLSVDRCSSDPSRCWNLLEPPLAGPDGLVAYLAALAPQRGGLKFRWRRAG